MGKNHSYDRGRAWEYAIMDELAPLGWTVARSAASHGPIDIFAARSYGDAYGRPVFWWRRLLIQAKTNAADFPQEERDGLVKASYEFDGTPILAWRTGSKREYWKVESCADDDYRLDWPVFIRDSSPPTVVHRI